MRNTEQSAVEQDTPSFAAWLIEQGRLDPDKLDRALRLQIESGKRLETVLVQLGLVAERDIAEAFSIQFDLPLVRVEEYPHVPVLRDYLSPEFFKQSRIVPLAEDDERIVVATADPTDEFALRSLEFATGKSISAKVGASSDIESTLERQYPENSSSMEQIVDDIQGAEAEAELDDIQHLKDLASEAPIIRMVNLMISRALQVNASDIHIEPFEDELKLRYRIDGILRDMEAPPTRHSAAVVSRIKVMANLDIAERRLPQDGRIRLRMEGHDVDMRISTVPTMYGESVVMRILDKRNLQLDFKKLGFTLEIMSGFETMLERPQGIILVTGPTGSGKTTTLYAALHQLNTPEKKIITIEDPVEYQLAGVNQIQVKARIGLDFANALRSILRQDPDVVMIGEMRDSETARIAVQSALTGHKVFSTLHTNDAASSVTRLLDMGVEDYLLASSLSGVLAQRLIRTLCPHCREPFRAPGDLVERMSLHKYGHNGELILYRAVGCDQCNDLGYRGRTSILELLAMSDPVRDAILRSGDSAAIKRTAVESGMLTMYQDGIGKVVAGITTTEEVMRAVQET